MFLLGTEFLACVIADSLIVTWGCLSFLNDAESTTKLCFRNLFICARFEILDKVYEDSCRLEY